MMNEMDTTFALTVWYAKEPSDAYERIMELTSDVKHKGFLMEILNLL